MSTDWRALCAELISALADFEPLNNRELAALNRARAALAAGSDGPAVQSREPASVVREPSDEDLLELAEDWPATTGPRHDLSGCPEVPLYSVFADEVVEFARAALARWGHQPAPAAEGEVRGLVAELRSTASGLESQSYPQTAALITRAADLLEQRHPTPVPVSERLPGPEDCDAEGRCWLLTVEDEYPQWRLHSIEGNQPGGSTMIWVPVDSSPGVMVDAFYASHWLPATALPLPAVEVQ